MITTLLVFQFILTVVLTITVLLQKSSSIGLGAYSGSNESVFGAKGPDGFLAKFTFAIGAAFVINTIALGYVYNKQNKDSIAETIAGKEPITPKSTAPKAPEAPTTPTSTSTPATPVIPVTPAEKDVNMDVKTPESVEINTTTTPVENNQTK